jgi:hypothetical protein
MKGVFRVEITKKSGKSQSIKAHEVYGDSEDQERLFVLAMNRERIKHPDRDKWRMIKFDEIDF